MMKCPLVTIIALALMTFSMNAKDKYPYQNAGLPVEQRVEDLLSRMTLEEKAGQIKVCKLDVDEAPEIAAKYGIASIPTLMVFLNGEAVRTSVGVQPKAAIEAMLP